MSLIPDDLRSWYLSWAMQSLNLKCLYVEFVHTWKLTKFNALGEICCKFVSHGISWQSQAVQLKKEQAVKMEKKSRQWIWKKKRKSRQWIWSTFCAAALKCTGLYQRAWGILSVKRSQKRENAQQKAGWKLKLHTVTFCMMQLWAWTSCFVSSAVWCMHRWGIQKWKFTLKVID